MGSYCRECGVPLDIAEKAKREIQVEVETALSFRPDLTGEQILYFVKKMAPHVGVSYRHVDAFVSCKTCWPDRA